MSWNLLAYAVPAWHALLAWKATQPATYQVDEEAPESCHTERVREIVKRVLTQENRESSPYYGRIQELLQGSSDIETFVATHIKVSALNEGSLLFPIVSGGTDQRYYISIPATFREGYPKESLLGSQQRPGALPWLVTRQVYHFLEGNHIHTLCKWKALASLTATVTSTYFFGWGLFPSLAMGLSASSFTRLALDRSASLKADDFANERCSPEERVGAIVHLRDVNLLAAQKLSIIEHLFFETRFTNSEERIEKIERADPLLSVDLFKEAT